MSENWKDTSFEWNTVKLPFLIVRHANAEALSNETQDELQRIYQTSLGAIRKLLWNHTDVVFYGTELSRNKKTIQLIQNSLWLQDSEVILDEDYETQQLGRVRSLLRNAHDKVLIVITHEPVADECGIYWLENMEIFDVNTHERYRNT